MLRLNIETMKHKKEIILIMCDHYDIGFRTSIPIITLGIYDNQIVLNIICVC